MSAAFPSPTAFMESLVDEVNAEWLRHGVDGCRLVAVTWDDGTAMLETRSGPQRLTVEDVRAALPKMKAA